MRLIDADKVDFSKVFGGSSSITRDIIVAAQSVLDEQPIAFDKEAVIDELNSDAKQWHESGVEFKDKREKGIAEGLKLAIETVEKGGIG